MDEYIKTNDFTELLIEVVREHKVIWNNSLPPESPAVREAWEKVAQECEIGTECECTFNNPFSQCIFRNIKKKELLREITNKLNSKYFVRLTFFSISNCQLKNLRWTILITVIDKLKDQWAILRKKYMENCEALIRNETTKQWAFFKNMAFLEATVRHRNKINVFSTF